MKLSKMKKLRYLLLLVSVLQSCTTSRSVISNCKAQPKKLNIENINGMYAGKGLWNEFHENKTSKTDTTKYSESVQTKIHFDGKKYITANVYDRGINKNEITLKAKVYKDYISVKKRHKLLPFLPVYFYSSVHKFVLYNNAENNLGLCGYGSTMMVVFIMSGGKGGDYSATYKRVGNTN